MPTDAPLATWVEMAQPHFTPGRARPIKILVIHATAGRFPGDFATLRRGENAAGRCSCHYYIDKSGAISQFVREADTAWHAGRSQWRGLEVAGTLNPCSIGIEISNLNTAVDPYPDAQLSAAVALCRDIVARRGIERANLVRHLDISPGRKSDPAGFQFKTFVDAVYGEAAPRRRITADSPILAPFTIDEAARLIEAFARRCARAGSPYMAEPADPVRTAIGPAYADVCARAGVDLAVALGQCGHETGWLVSALSQRTDKDGNNIRNPAGIGVDGSTSPGPAPGFVWDADRQQYRAAVGFANWLEAINAHVGRLVAYAVSPQRRTPAQAALAQEALRRRGLPGYYQGAAPRIRDLGTRWAPDDGYGERVAAAADSLLGGGT